MTKKDYILIANAIESSFTDGEGVENHVWNLSVSHVARQLAITLGEDNAMFNRVRFLKACGVMIAK